MTAKRKPKVIRTSIEVLRECEACSGTGLYSGMCEVKGTAVVCLRCGGAGGVREGIALFVRRKRLRGIKTIRLSRGSFIGTGVGGQGPSMTYPEFQKRFKAAK